MEREDEDEDERVAALGELYVAARKGSRQELVELLPRWAAVDGNLDAHSENYCTPLHLAVASPTDALAKVEVLVRKGASLRAKDASGSTPLHRAVQCGDVALPVLEYLLGHSSGWDFPNDGDPAPRTRISAWDVRNSDGDTAHDLAVKGGHEKIIECMNTLKSPEFLCTRNPDDFVKNVKKGSRALLLQAAVKCQQMSLVKKLLARKSRTITQEEHTTLSLLAVQSGHEKIFKYLKKKGLDVTKVELCAAVRHGDVSVLTRLIDLGWELVPRTNKKEELCDKAVKIAVSQASVEMITFLLENDFPFNRNQKLRDEVMKIAVSQASVEMIEFLFGNGITLEDKARHSFKTVIRNAAIMRRDPEVIDCLQWHGIEMYGEEALEAVRQREDVLGHFIANGVVVDSLATKGPDRSLVNAALRSGRADLITYLDDQGLLKELMKGREHSLLQDAAQWSQLEIFKNLVHRGLNLDAKDSRTLGKGRTLLQAAVELPFIGEHNSVGAMNEEFMTYLSNAGVDTQSTYHLGRTALYLALFSPEPYNLRFAKILLDHGAAELIDARDQIGKSSLHCAAQDRKDAVVQLLLDRGASPSMPDKMGGTPLSHALSRIWLEKCSEARANILFALISHGAEWKREYAIRLDSWEGTKEPEYDSDESVQSEDSAYLPPSANPNLSDFSDSFDDHSEEVEYDEFKGFPRQDPQVIRALIVCVRAWLREKREGLGLTRIKWDVIERGPRAVEAHYRELGKLVPERKNTYHHRVCVLGSSKCGKTSLIESLVPRETSQPHEDKRQIGLNVSSYFYKDKRHHKVSLWEITGMDIFEAAFPRFFSERTHYLLCVDLPKYFEQMGDETKMDRFVAEHIFKWVRLILTRHPKADFQIVTRKDGIKWDDNNLQVMKDFNRRLRRWKSAFWFGIHDANNIRVSSPESDEVEAQIRNVSFGNWIFLSRRRSHDDDEGDVDRGTNDVRDAIYQSKCTLEFGRKHITVLAAVKRLAKKTEATRKTKWMINVRDLYDELVEGYKLSDVTTAEFLGCLNDLHALGEVLYFGDSESKAVATTVFFTPTIVTQSLHEIISEDCHKNGRVTHDQIKQLNIWKDLDEHEHLQLKSLLQHLLLVRSVDSDEMHADADLIVPGCWNLTKPKDSTPVPLHQQKSLLTRHDIQGKNTVCWEYELSVEVSNAVFTQLAARMCDGHAQRTTAHRDYFQDVAPGEIVAEVWLKHGNTPTDVIQIEVAANDVQDAWRRTIMYVVAMEFVLGEYPGLAVSRYIVVDTGPGSKETGRHELTTVIKRLNIEKASGAKSIRKDNPWLPPNWFLEVWNDQKATRWLRMQDAFDGMHQKMDAIHTSLIADPTLRLYPALWTLTCSEDKRRVEVRMLSDYSRKCFHEDDPIVIQGSRLFELLSVHGTKIQAGISILTNIVPEFISLGVFQNVVKMLQPVVEGAVDKDKRLHNLVNTLDVSSSKGFDSGSSGTPLAHGEAVLLLQELLVLKDPNFHTLKIPKLSGLEPAVNLNGDFLWAHADEITSSKGNRKLKSCFAGNFGPTAPSRSAPLAPSLSAPTSPSPSAPTASVTALPLTLVIVSVEALDDDAKTIYCEWQLLDASASGKCLKEGATSKPTDDTDRLSSTAQFPNGVPFDLSDVELDKCELVVQIKKKPSAWRRSMLRCSQRFAVLSTGALIGEGRTCSLTVDAEITIPVMSPNKQVAIVTCRITSA